MENNQVILFATCPVCGAEEECGRIINPEPEDIDEFCNDDRKQLCGKCLSKQRIEATAKEVLALLTSKGLSVAEALFTLGDTRSLIFNRLEKTAHARPLSEIISGTEVQ